MRYIKSTGTVDLTAVAVKGGLPTLPVGNHKGIFVGSTMDAGDHQWVTLSTTKGAHIEQTDMDVSDFSQSDRIEFSIAAQGGAVAVMSGSNYKLVGPDSEDITGWLPLDQLYVYIKDHQITLAEPKIKNVTKI